MGRAFGVAFARAPFVLVALLAAMAWARIDGMAADTARPDEFRWQLPEGVAPPPIPADNPMSEAKVELGRRFFFDVRLSFNGTTSCASCHVPEREFSDGRPRAIGASGVPHARNTPTLWNAAYNVSFTWIDQGLTSLESQLRIPLTGRDPVEMGFGPEQLAILATDLEIAELQRAAFGATPVTEQTVIQALAAYVRTLVRMDSAFDRYFYWDDASGFDASARQGMALFFSERLACSHCHAGAHLSGPTAAPDRVVPPVFHRTAVSDSTAAFRAPSLRFVDRTAPYMHDGILATLGEVVDFYARGGGVGAERLAPFALTKDERGALLAFLRSL